MATQKYLIDRYDPGADRHYQQEFTLEAAPGETVLDAMNRIKWEQDGTLTYRMSCRHAICGSCAIKINGRTMLACKMQVSEVAAGRDAIRLGPQGCQTVLKDLATDTTHFFGMFDKVKGWLQPPAGQTPPQREYRQSKDEFDHWSHASSCIHCGACYSDCTVAEVDPNFLGPAALAKAYRFVFDGRDAAKSDRLRALSQRHGIWDCTRCFMCVQACPKEVLPMDAIMELRTEAMKSGVPGTHGSRHSRAFAGGVKRRGRLDEASLPILSAGFRPGAIPELLAYTPGAIRLLASRKLIQAARRHGASPEGRKQIRRIFSEVADEKHHHNVDRESFMAEHQIALGG